MTYCKIHNFSKALKGSSHYVISCIL